MWCTQTQLTYIHATQIQIHKLADKYTDTKTHAKEHDIMHTAQKHTQHDYITTRNQSTATFT